MDDTKSAGCNELSGPTDDAEFTTNDIIGGEMVLDKALRRASYRQPILVRDTVLYEDGDKHVLDDSDDRQPTQEVQKQ